MAEKNRYVKKMQKAHIKKQHRLTRRVPYSVVTDVVFVVFKDGKHAALGNLNEYATPDEARAAIDLWRNTDDENYQVVRVCTSTFFEIVE